VTASVIERLTKAGYVAVPTSIIQAAINAAAQPPPLFFLAPPIPIFRVLTSKTLNIEQNIGEEVLLFGLLEEDTTKGRNMLSKPHFPLYSGSFEI
jgi:hypothetical protein